MFVEDVASYQALVCKLESSGGQVLWLWDEIGKVLPSLHSDKTSNLSGILTIIMRLYTSADSSFLPHVKADDLMLKIKTSFNTNIRMQADFVPELHGIVAEDSRNRSKYRRTRLFGEFITTPHFRKD